MSGRGIDIRSNVEVRIDRSPLQQVERTRGSSYGVLWQGRATVARRVTTRTPLPHVYAVGAHTTLSPATPFAGLTAALVADVIGPAVVRPATT